jgi:hypothetical protein
MGHDNPLDARKIIAAVHQQVEQNISPMFDVVLVPNAIRLTFHPDDYRKWQNRFGLLAQQAKKSLGVWLKGMNQRSFLSKIGKRDFPYSLLPGSDWALEIVSDPNHTVQEGEVMVEVNAETGKARDFERNPMQGSETEVLGGTDGAETEPVGNAARDTAVVTPNRGMPGMPRAVLVRWSDGAQERQKVVNKDILSIGRGGGVDWVDVKLDHTTISRVHLKVRQAGGGDLQIFDCSENGVEKDGVRMSREEWQTVPAGAKLTLPSGTWLSVELAESVL